MVLKKKVKEELSLSLKIILTVFILGMFIAVINHYDNQKAVLYAPSGDYCDTSDYSMHHSDGTTITDSAGNAKPCSPDVQCISGESSGGCQYSCPNPNDEKKEIGDCSAPLDEAGMWGEAGTGYAQLKCLQCTPVGGDGSEGGGPSTGGPDAGGVTTGKPCGWKSGTISRTGSQCNGGYCPPKNGVSQECISGHSISGEPTCDCQDVVPAPKPGTPLPPPTGGPTTGGPDAGGVATDSCHETGKYPSGVPICGGSCAKENQICDPGVGCKCVDKVKTTNPQPVNSNNCGLAPNGEQSICMTQLEAQAGGWTPVPGQSAQGICYTENNEPAACYY